MPDDDVIDRPQTGPLKVKIVHVAEANLVRLIVLEHDVPRTLMDFEPGDAVSVGDGLRQAGLMAMQASKSLN